MISTTNTILHTYQSPYITKNNARTAYHYLRHLRCSKGIDYLALSSSGLHGDVAQSVEHRTENP